MNTIEELPDQPEKAIREEKEPKSSEGNFFDWSELSEEERKKIMAEGENLAKATLEKTTSQYYSGQMSDEDATKALSLLQEEFLHKAEEAGNTRRGWKYGFALAEVEHCSLAKELMEKRMASPEFKKAARKLFLGDQRIKKEPGADTDKYTIH